MILHAKRPSSSTPPHLFLPPHLPLSTLWWPGGGPGPCQLWWSILQRTRGICHQQKIAAVEQHTRALLFLTTSGKGITCSHNPCTTDQLPPPPTPQNSYKIIFFTTVCRGSVIQYLNFKEFSNEADVFKRTFFSMSVSLSWSCFFFSPCMHEGGWAGGREGWKAGGIEGGRDGRMKEGIEGGREARREGRKRGR